MAHIDNRAAAARVEAAARQYARALAEQMEGLRYDDSVQTSLDVKRWKDQGQQRLDELLQSELTRRGINLDRIKDGRQESFL